MIFILFAIFCVLTIAALVIAFFFELKKSRQEPSVLILFPPFIVILTITFFVLTNNVIGQINEANNIKSQLILMKPLDKFREDIAINEKELAKVERLIERAFDKNNPNVSVKMEGGVKIYSFLGSSDLGSAEIGNAEKQKLLLKYIEKQNEIADKLIYVKKLAYGDEYYKLQQEYAVYVNNIFSGWLVNWFSIKEDYQPIKNQIYAPNDKNNI